MLDRANRTFICSVVFLDIVEYSRKPVAEQISLKERFNGLLSEALQDIAVNDRIILDTGDGAAISFLGDPEDALFVALSLRDAIAAPTPAEAHALQVRVGINLGPVKLVKDINGQPNIIGDGVNVAQRIMSFAQPGQVLVSRSYYEVVSCLSQEYAQLFHYEGSRTDKHVREHEVYAVGYAGRDLRQVAAHSGKQRAKAVADNAPGATTDATGGAVASPAGKGGKGKLLAVALSVSAVILAAGLVLRGAKHHQTEAPTDAAAPVASVEPGKASVAAPSVEAATRRSPSPSPPAEAKTPPPEGSSAAPAEPGAFVGLAIAPWGEVYLDGKKQGVSPPLRVIQVSPGKHTVEIRNSAFPPYAETIDIKPKERVKIKHKFR